MARLDVPQGTGKGERQSGTTPTRLQHSRFDHSLGVGWGLIHRAKMDAGQSDSLREHVVAESE